MRAVVMFLVLTLAGGFAVAAPWGERGTCDRQGQGKGDPTAMLTRVLDLRPDQVEPVSAILQAQRQKGMQLRQENRREMGQMHEETRNRLAEVLDTEQLARFDGFVQGRHPGRIGGRQGGMSGSKAE